MSVRELIALGTASQVPTPDRNQNGYLIRWDDEGVLLDPGEGTQRQLIFADVTATSVTRVFISHFHGDHSLGFAGICQRLSLDRVPHVVHVYFPASGEVFFDRLRKASIYHATQKLEPHPIRTAGALYSDGKIALEAFELDHTVECYGFRLREHDRRTMLPEKLRAAGVAGRAIGELSRTGSIEVDGTTVRVEDVSVPKRGQRVGFVPATRPCRGAQDLSEDADVLLTVAPFRETERKEAERRKELTAREAGSLARTAGADRLVVSGYAPYYADGSGHEAEALEEHPNTVAAVDCGRYPIRLPS